MKKQNNTNSLVSLREYFDEKMEDLEEKIDLHFKLVELATKKAEDKLDIMMQNHCEKIEDLYRWVYTGIGIAIAISFVMKFIDF